MLCDLCQPFSAQALELDTDPFRRRWKSSRSCPSTLPNLHQHASEGCNICRTNVKQLQRESLDSSKLSEDLEIVYRLQTPEDPLEDSALTVTLHFKSNFTVSSQFQLERVATEGIAAKKSSNTNSAETLQFIQNCFDQCRKSHSQCDDRNQQDQQWYPTRLIDLQASSNGETNRLIITAESSPSEPYASLSHCWGKANIIKLTEDTLESFMNEIPLSSLPNTFSNAFKVARSLGMRYIWIDSLCIMQDSAEDWRREAALMMSVYKNAYCNIAATKSNDSHGGLFTTRDPRALPSDIMRIENGPLNGSFQLISRDYWQQEIDDAILNTRAWVVQERLLSRRIIHFASEQVFWDCSELLACEAFPEDVRTWAGLEARSHIGSKKASQRAKGDGYAQRKWAEVVTAYSRARLTFQSDKLVAISGIVEEYRGIMKDEYCAGLWRRKIEMQLAWLLGQPLASRPQSSVARAPSWSWLSVDGPIDYPQIYLYDDYEIVEQASVTDMDLQEQITHEGEIITGFLRMRCVLNPVKLTRENGEIRFTGVGTEYIRSFDLDYQDVIQLVDLFFLPLFEVLFDTGSYMASEMRGILVTLTDKTLGTFSRCGHVFVAGNAQPESGEFETGYVKLKSPEDKEDLPCEHFDSSLGHLIRLV